MATIAFTDGYVNINSNNLSAYSHNAALTYEVEELDETAFGDDTRIRKGGLKNWNMEIEFHQDFADNLLDEILFALLGTTVTCAIRPTSGSKSTSNPEYTGTGLIQSYKPIGNAVGDLAGASLSIVSAGTLTRATS